MARNRNDSGGSSNHAQMRASFTDSYRKHIGRQDGKKNIKGVKEMLRRNEMKVNQANVIRDLFIVTTVLLTLFAVFYIMIKILYGELGDFLRMPKVKE